jgi:hypothetical protein
MTADGIASADLDRVHELSVDIVNCSTAGDEAGEARARAPLIALLDQLDEKYGPKPSLLATQADYVESSGDRERLFLAAHSEAERIADGKNRELTAHSLAELCIEEVPNLDEGAKWLGIWRNELGTEAIQYDVRELTRLETILLRGGAASR